MSGQARSPQFALLLADWAFCCLTKRAGRPTADVYGKLGVKSLTGGGLTKAGMERGDLRINMACAGYSLYVRGRRPMKKFMTTKRW